MGSLPGGIAGSPPVIGLPHYTQNAEQYVKRAIGGLLILVSIILVIRIAFPGNRAASGGPRRPWLEQRER